MAGISAIGGGGVSNLQFQAQRAAQVVNLQKQALDQQGELALQLLESVANSGVGTNLNVRI